MVHVGIALFVCLFVFWGCFGSHVGWYIFGSRTKKQTQLSQQFFMLERKHATHKKWNFTHKHNSAKTSPNSCAKCKRACVYIVPPKGWDKSTHTTPQNIEQSGPLLSLRHCALLILSAPFPSQKEHSKRTLMGRVRSKETCKSCPPKTEHTHPFAIKKETRVPKQKANAPQYLLRIGTFTTAKRPSSLKRTYLQTNK